MTTTQRPPIGRADTAPTAAQKVVAAMWTLGKPATSKAIAAAAEVGYSTVTPILRNLLADNQAVKTDGDSGTAEWQLTATLPTPIAGEAQAQAPTPTPTEPAPPADSTDATSHQRDDADDADEPDDADQPSGSTNPADGPQAVDPSDEDTSAEPVSHTRSGSDAADTAPDAASPSDMPGGAGADDAVGTAPEASQDPEQGAARTYRKPEQPRRPKGELRAAVLAVLTGSPDEPFKVSEVCKAIDAANTDRTSNKAGAGAVANALDKLVTSGDAIRVEEAKYATYQAAPAGG